MTSTPSLDPAMAAQRPRAAARGFPSRRADALRMIAPLGAAALVCVLVIVAVETSRAAGLIASLWAAAAVGVVAWLRSPARPGFDLTFGAMLAAAFAVANLLVGNDAVTTTVFTTANTLEVVTAVLLLRRFGGKLDFRSVEGFCRFMLVGAVLPPILSGLIVSTYMNAIGWAAFQPAFETWWYGHALGLAVIGPLGLSFRKRHLSQLRNPRHILEAIALLGGTVALGLIVFASPHAVPTFVLVPLLILVAVRLRLPGVGLGLLILSIISVGAALTGQGPIAAAGDNPGGHVRLAQLFMIMGGLPALLVAVLLEERDQLAETARADQARAERASEGKSRLLANVAHEIKSPIGGVIGIAELWRDGKLGAVTQSQAEMSDMLVRTARQIEALARDLLDVAHAEAGAVSVDLRPTDVGALLEDVRRAAALRPEARSMRLETILPPGRMLVMADSVRLSQVLTNLTSNALKYGASGGVVTFTAGEKPDGRVRLSIIDRGPGLSAAKQAELFEPFNRLGMEKTAVEGHGIGLALAKRLVELQGGRIGVDSAPGEGAAFWVELPAA